MTRTSSVTATPLDQWYEAVTAFAESLADRRGLGQELHWRAQVEGLLAHLGRLGVSRSDYRLAVAYLQGVVAGAVGFAEDAP